MVKTKLVKFLRDENGLTTVEYAVAGALISLAVIVSFTNLGLAVAGVLDAITAVLP